jgi:hypothetical protein
MLPVKGHSMRIRRQLTPTPPPGCWGSRALSARRDGRTVNAIMRLPFWKSAAIVILYDDSDGWYDHQMGPIVHSFAVNTGSTANSDELHLR